jgi:hypothetical protein
MTISNSQGLCEALAELHGTTGLIDTDIALNDNGAGVADTITQSGGSLTTYFTEGDMVRVLGSTSNDDEYLIVTAADAALTLLPDVLAATEAAGSTIALVTSTGGSIRDVINGGTLTIFNGTKPTTADASSGGATALFTFTDVTFGDATWDATNLQSYIDLYGGTAISETADAAGTASWYRFTAPGSDITGASTTAKRFDGTVGLGSGTADMKLSTVSYSVGDPLNISTFKIRVHQAGG